MRPRSKDRGSRIKSTLLEWHDALIHRFNEAAIKGPRKFS